MHGKQCTMLWHVDDLEISHAEKGVIDDLIQQVQLEFGQEPPLTVHCGRKHNYLGMTLDFSLDGQVQIQMFNYITKNVGRAPIIHRQGRQHTFY